jgi:hypothetical protein
MYNQGASCMTDTGVRVRHCPAGHYDENLLDRVGNYVAKQLSGYTAQHLANLSWAYNKLAHIHPRLLAAIAEAALTKLKVC